MKEIRIDVTKQTEEELALANDHAQIIFDFNNTIPGTAEYAELMTAISAGGCSARHSECRMLEQMFHSPLYGFWGNGGSLLLEAATCFSNFVFAFIGIRNQRVRVRVAWSLVALQLSVWSCVSATFRVLHLGSVSGFPHRHPRQVAPDFQRMVCDKLTPQLSPAT